MTTQKIAEIRKRMAQRKQLYNARNITIVMCCILTVVIACFLIVKKNKKDIA